MESRADRHRETGTVGRDNSEGSLRHSTPRHDTGRFWVWFCALIGIAAIAVVYYFAFSAAHTAQIRDIPLATKGGKP
jgi:hypothetical protein